MVGPTIYMRMRRHVEPKLIITGCFFLIAVCGIFLRLWSYVSLVACFGGRTGYNGGNHGASSRYSFDAGTTGGGIQGPHQRLLIFLRCSWEAWECNWSRFGLVSL